MKSSDFFYELPQELIAQEPLEERSMSRLMVLDRKSGSIEHKVFKNIIEYLKPGDCLVLNDTRVIPARLLGTREGTGGKIEFVLLKSLGEDTWEVILKPGRKAKPGARFEFGGGLLKAEIKEVLDEGNRLVKFEYQGVFEEILDRVGVMPLPPYITHKLQDAERYQTVYSRHKGSAAAPTAGLHFTPELLDRLRERGVELRRVTLHVGIGTFEPVTVSDVTTHQMHSERYSIDEENAVAIEAARRDPARRVVAVGTTTVRTLEACFAKFGEVCAANESTNIFIYPGYRFGVVDAMTTNFHLPGSTLLLLVAAFAGTDRILAAYAEAIRERYRFYSYGDAMFIE
jgi:S-adenosylmethionine:tRNA ribosyltransferase-isomerase